MMTSCPGREKPGLSLMLTSTIATPLVMISSVAKLRCGLTLDAQNSRDYQQRGPPRNSQNHGFRSSESWCEFAFDVARVADCSHNLLSRSEMRSVHPITKLLIASRRSSLLGAASIRKSTISTCTKLVRVSSNHVANCASAGSPQNTMPLPSSLL